METRLQECYDFAIGCIKNAQPYSNVVDDMQIFKDVFNIPEKVYIATSPSQLRQMKRGKIQEHILSLGRTGIYGLTKAYGAGEGIVAHIRFMDGAISQAGRMPEDEDGFHFMYLCGNGVKRWFYIYDWWEDYVRMEDGLIERWGADLDMKKPPVEYQIYNWQILSECALRRNNGKTTNQEG